MKKEAFVYCWYNILSNKKYIGYHKGFEEDGYVSSSGSNLFWEDFNKGLLKRQILCHGTVSDCRSLELKILKNVDWKSDEYYNLSIGGSTNFALNNPMFRKETREYFSNLHKNRIFTDEWRLNISKGLTGKKQSNETKAKRRIIMAGNKYAKGNKLTDDHKEILREKAINNNPMQNPESVEKIRQSKLGTKSLYKNGKMKKAKPNSEKWQTLILQGWEPKQLFLDDRK
jgi:hypothetical protein